MADDRLSSALQRVHAVAEYWAAQDGDDLGSALDRRIGGVLLDAIDKDPRPLRARLEHVRQLAEHWRTPGATLFYPAAGQAVLDAISHVPADDDRLSSTLEAMRQRCEHWITSMGLTEASVRDSPFGDLRRALAALDAALEHHQPRQLYGMVESFKREPLCDHDPDYDGDRHFEADDGIWYCTDKPTVKVCISCTDGPDGDLWAEWPCPTCKDITRALAGEAGDDPPPS